MNHTLHNFIVIQMPRDIPFHVLMRPVFYPWYHLDHLSYPLYIRNYYCYKEYIMYSCYYYYMGTLYTHSTVLDPMATFWPNPNVYNSLY